MNTRLWARIGLLAMALTMAMLLLAFQAEGAGAATPTSSPSPSPTSSPSPSPSPSPTPAPTATASPTPVPVPIAVTIKEFSVSANPASSATSVVELNVANQGALDHELVIMQTDKAVDALTYDTVADRAVESAPGQEDVGEVEDIAAGTTKSGTFDLAPGHYLLICNIAGHYKAGMRTAFTVGVAAPTAAPSPVPTPTAAAVTLGRFGGPPQESGGFPWAWLVAGFGLVAAGSFAWRRLAR